MRMSYTDKLQAEYAKTYNKYMTLPDDSKELKPLTKKLQEMEEQLTRLFLLESGYSVNASGEFSLYIKDGQ